MNTASSLIAALGQLSFAHRSSMLGDRAIVGVVASPAALERLPIQAFVVPASQIHDSTLRRFMDRMPSDVIASVRTQNEPLLVSGESRQPSFLFLPKLPENPFCFALGVLAERGIERVVFLKPLHLGGSGRVDVANWDPALLVGGLLTFHDEEPAGGPAEILIPFKDESQMRRFFERLESDLARTPAGESQRSFKVSEEDPYQEVVAAYLDERSRPSAGGPSLLVPYHVIADVPFHQARRRQQELPLDLADLETPASGCVRLFSDALLDRAMTMVPEALRNPEATMLPPFVYARFAKGNETERELTGAKGRKVMVALLSPISETVFSVQDNRSGHIVVIGEIALADLPRRSVEHSALLTHMFFASAFPFEMASFVQAFSGDRVVPASVLDAVLRRARRVEGVEFSAGQLDLMLIHQVLHECAEILWHVLPDSFRSRWKKLFPLGQDEEASGVYFRNLLRIYTEGVAEDPAEFFASESFADIMAFHWADDVPETLRALNEGLVAKHRAFFDDVMAWVHERRKKEGSAFLLDR